MQINILEIAQGLIDKLLVEEQKNRHRAEGVAMLFQALQEAHAAAMGAEKETQLAEMEPQDVQ